MLENKVQKANRLAMEALPGIAIATSSAEGFTFASESICTVLVKKGLAETNNEVVNEAGEIAIRATDLGIQTAQIAKVETAVTPNKERIMFELENIAVEVPLNKRGSGNGSRGCKYPFAALEIGQSFFVPATEAVPDPVKNMNAAGSVAAIKMGTPTGEVKTTRTGRSVPVVLKSHKFVAVADVKNGVSGARVGRVA